MRDIQDQPRTLQTKQNKNTNYFDWIKIDSNVRLMIEFITIAVRQAEGNKKS